MVLCLIRKGNFSIVGRALLFIDHLRGNIVLRYILPRSRQAGGAVRRELGLPLGEGGAHRLRLHPGRGAVHRPVPGRGPLVGPRELHGAYHRVGG